MSFYVYIIYSRVIDKYYIGYTVDLAKRLEQHNAGISVFTSKAIDWQLKYTEAFDTRALAVRREKESRRRKAGNTLNG